MLTRQQVEEKLSGIITHSFERGVSCVSWMGIEISWQQKPKYCGGNCQRGKTWGTWEYKDNLSSKTLTYEEAVAEILKPFEERKSKKDLTKIKYCTMCGNIGVGEEELLLWGRLMYVSSITHNKGLDWKYATHKWADVCLKCCRKIRSK